MQGLLLEQALFHERPERIFLRMTCISLAICNKYYRAGFDDEVEGWTLKCRLCDTTTGSGKTVVESD